MIPASFDYVRARSIEEARAVLDHCGPSAVLLAGGHSLLPRMRYREVNPAVLVDVSRVPGLSGVQVEGSELRIGAAVTYAVLASSALVRAEAAVLAHAAGTVGDPHVRNRGTIGGSVAHADPAADLPAVLLTLGATMVVHGPGGSRAVRAADFFRAPGRTALGPADVLTEVRVPRVPGSRWSYHKFHRRSHEWAMVAVTAVQPVAAAGPLVGLANMGPLPLRALDVERLAAQGAPAVVAAEQAANGTAPPSDVRADGDYRAHVARVLTERALNDLAIAAAS